MKSMILKKALFLAGFFFMITGIYAQKGVDDGSKYGKGEDSIRCLRNLSLYREFARHKNYSTALPYWKIVFNECPRASKNIYIDGANIYKDLLDNVKDEQHKNDFSDTLMLIYERRIQYYGEKSEVRGRQGVDLLRYRRNDDIKYIREAYNYLSESVQIEKDKSSEAALATCMSASLALYQNKLIDAGKCIQDYLQISAIINASLLKNPSNKDLQNVKTGVDEGFVKDGPGDCESLISSFSKEYDTKSDNVDFLRSMTILLRSRNCIKSDLFYTASKKLNNLEPSAESAYNIAILAYNAAKFQEAIDYYRQAINLEENENKKADYYLGISASNSKMGNKIKSREFAQKALEVRPNWGEPYLIIGQLYLDSQNDCNDLKLPMSIFWVAVDQFVKAKAADPAVEERANKLIATYSKYYPNKEEAFFHNVTEGVSFTVDCWINENTKARFND